MFGLLKKAAFFILSTTFGLEEQAKSSPTSNIPTSNTYPRRVKTARHSKIPRKRLPSYQSDFVVNILALPRCPQITTNFQLVPPP